jgi:hypothetical protein
MAKRPKGRLRNAPVPVRVAVITGVFALIAALIAIIPVTLPLFRRPEPPASQPSPSPAPSRDRDDTPQASQPPAPDKPPDNTAGAPQTTRMVAKVERPASAPASRLFLQRVLQPPVGPIAEGTTVWLSATGNQTFVVDSLRVIHHPSSRTSGATGVRPPDAKYFFQYLNGQDTTFALDPALVIDPADQREVSFRLDVMPRGGVSGSSYVELFLGYHSSSGQIRWLRVDAPTPHRQQLAGLVNRDVIEDKIADTGLTQIVTSSGNQRVLDPGDPPPLEFDDIRLGRIDELEASFPVTSGVIRGVRGRAHVNTAIAAAKKLDEALTLMASGQSLGFQLCAGLTSDPCRRALVGHAGLDRDWARVADALAAIHVQRPSDDLATFVLAHPPPNESARSSAAVALTAEPRGRWAEALLALARGSPEPLVGLYLRLWDMDPKTREAVGQIAWRVLQEQTRERDTALKIALQLGPSLEATLQRAQALPDKYGQVSQLIERVAGLQLLADLGGIGLERERLRVWPRSSITGAPLALERLPRIFTTPDGEFRLAQQRLPLEVPPGRARLWSLIESRGQKGALFAHINTYQESALLGIEMLSHSADHAESRSMLARFCDDRMKSYAALSALASLHLRFPSGDLARCYLSRLALRDQYFHADSIAALWLVREGEWLAALVQSAFSEQQNLTIEAVWRALYDLRDQLPAAQRDALKSRVTSVLAGGSRVGLAENIRWITRFALWFGMDGAEVLKAVRNGGVLTDAFGGSPQNKNLEQEVAALVAASKK